MQWNKKTAYLLAALSLLIGSAGAIGIQAYAQQNPAVGSSTQIQTQSGTTGEQKDNGQPDSALEQEKGKEAKDGTEADENLPGGGHHDQARVNVDHQFDGVE